MTSDVLEPSGARRRTTLGIAMAMAMAVGACSGPAPAPTGTPVSSQAPVASATPTALAGPATIEGTWAGELHDASNTYPVRLVLDGCADAGTPCGDLEYADPGNDASLLCASELTYTGAEAEGFGFSERVVYHPWMCLATEFHIRSDGATALHVDQVIGGEVCCSGTLLPVAAAPSVDLGPVAGLGRTTSRTRLGGATTQYSAAAEGSLWFPIEDGGAVARIDEGTGTLSAWIVTEDGNLADGPPAGPHSIVAGDAGIWVPLAGARSVGQIGPASNTVTKKIEIGVVAYALALAGNTLWVASFESDVVIPVDLKTGKAGAAIEVAKPTGIAVGLGSVWVVRHRDDSVVRIDPDSGSITATISLGDRGPSDVCGMCVENVVVADGAVWTANNHGRSIGRIDPKTNDVTSISVPLRVWAVAAGNGAVWASQYEATTDDRFVDPGTWGIVRIDTATGMPSTFAFDGAFAVTTSAGAIWSVVPGQRGDDVARIALEP